ncbi:MAG: acylphosphatase [Caldilineae bacterium]|nr:MAG: acylphosphatase [Caldilineae bacterium]
MKEIVAKHVLIEGRVQGVFFRQSTQRKALSLGVNGWVRNLPDGRVEVKAWGPPAAVNELVRWCHRGPANARVTNVIVEDAEPEPGSTGFRVRYF